MEGGFGFPFGGDPDELMKGLREFAERQTEAMQESQREQFATLTLNTAVELTGAALGQMKVEGLARRAGDRAARRHAGALSRGGCARLGRTPGLHAGELVPLPDPGTLAVFVAAALALLLVPGPAVLYIVAQSIEHGRTAGLVSMLGIQVGGLVHVAAAALGLSALLVQSSVAFNVVKFAGAAYLVFLGLRKLFTRERFETTGERPPRRLDRLFAQGIVVNILNPKTALFFFAFLPQFVSVEEGSVGLQIAVLGLLFILIAMVSDGLYALAAGTASEWLRGSRVFLRAERWVSGTVLVLLGVTAALSGPQRK